MLKNVCARYSMGSEIYFLKPVHLQRAEVFYLGKTIHAIEHSRERKEQHFAEMIARVTRSA